MLLHMCVFIMLEDKEIPIMSILQALKHHGIENHRQLPKESDFDCAKRWLGKCNIAFIVRAVDSTQYIVFSKLTIGAISAKITMQSSLEQLLMVQPFIEFIDGEVASY